MTNPTLLSIVIPTYHRNELLAKCLDCLAPGVQSLNSDLYEVIVTDDGSQYTAEAMIEKQYPWVKWVSGPTKGPAANRNNGVKHTTGEWLVFTDDDCLPDSHWLEEYAKATANHADSLVFEGRVYADKPRKSLAERSPLKETEGSLWSCNLAIQKKLFISLDGFDERFPYAAMEDIDLRIRLDRIDRKSVFIYNASVCHPWRIVKWKETKQRQQSVIIYVSIHPSEKKRYNPARFIKLSKNQFLKDTLPNFFKFKGKGIKCALLEHLSFWQTAYSLWLKKPS